MIPSLSHVVFISAASALSLAPVPAVVQVTRPAYDGLTVTSFNKWSTLPLLQLQGDVLCRDTGLST